MQQKKKQNTKKNFNRLFLPTLISMCTKIMKLPLEYTALLLSIRLYSFKQVKVCTEVFRYKNKTPAPNKRLSKLWMSVKEEGGEGGEEVGVGWGGVCVCLCLLFGEGLKNDHGGLSRGKMVVSIVTLTCSQKKKKQEKCVSEVSLHVGNSFLVGWVGGRGWVVGGYDGGGMGDVWSRL